MSKAAQYLRRVKSDFVDRGSQYPTPHHVAALMAALADWGCGGAVRVVGSRGGQRPLKLKVTAVTSYQSVAYGILI